MTRTTVGYLGCDHMHAPMYLETLAQLPVDLTCAFVADSDRRTESLAVPDDARIYHDAATLFESESVDVAWISASNAATPALVERAAGAGVDAYVEKPAARTAAALDPAMRAVADADVSVGVGYQNRAHPAAGKLRRLASDGFFGTLRAVELRMATSRLQYRDQSDPAYDRASSRGGVLQWLGCHLLDLVMWILDESIVSVSARTLPADDERVDVEAGAAATFELATGAVGTLAAGYYRRGYDTTVAIYGSDGQAKWSPTARNDRNRNVLELERTDGGRRTAGKRTVAYQYEDAPGYGGTVGLDYVESFLAAREDGGRRDETTERRDETLVASLADAASVLAVLDAAYDSASTGRRVDVEPPSL